jgi:hypothetical protein
MPWATSASLSRTPSERWRCTTPSVMAARVALCARPGLGRPELHEHHAPACRSGGALASARARGSGDGRAPAAPQFDGLRPVLLRHSVGASPPRLCGAFTFRPAASRPRARPRHAAMGSVRHVPGRDGPRRDRARGGRHRARPGGPPGLRRVPQPGLPPVLPGGPRRGAVRFWSLGGGRTNGRDGPA